MSKDRKPEVGDVYWSNEWSMSVIITFSKYGLYWGLWSSGQSITAWKKDDFKDLQYLGKSKTNIDDLFKTENEE